MVFVRTQQRAERLAANLKDSLKIPVDFVHADRSVSQRKKIWENFQTGEIQVKKKKFLK